MIHPWELTADEAWNAAALLFVKELGVTELSDAELRIARAAQKKLDARWWADIQLLGSVAQAHVRPPDVLDMVISAIARLEADHKAIGELA